MSVLSPFSPQLRTLAGAVGTAEKCQDVWPGRSAKSCDRSWARVSVRANGALWRSRSCRRCAGRCVALYAVGVFLLRSFVWNVATVGIAMVLLSLVLNDASAVEHAARSGLYCRSLAPSPVD